MKEVFYQFDSLINEEKYREAAELIEPLIKDDSAYAKYLAAELTLHSIPTHRAMEEVFGEISREKALLWLKQAADAGVPEAQFHHSHLHFEDHEYGGEVSVVMGWEIPSDFHRLRYLARSASSGYSDAQFEYGKILFRTSNIRHKAKGNDYLVDAANQGHVEASLYLLLSKIASDKKRIDTLIHALSTTDRDKYYRSECLEASSLINLLINNNLVLLSEYEYLKPENPERYNISNFRWDSGLIHVDIDGTKSKNALTLSSSILRRVNHFIKDEKVENEFIRRITKDLFNANSYHVNEAHAYSEFLKTSSESHDECIRWCAFLSSCYAEIMFLFNSGHIAENLEALYLDGDNIVKREGGYTVQKPISFYTLPSLFSQLSTAVPEVRRMLEQFLNKGMVIDLKGLLSYLPNDASGSLLDAFLKQFLNRHPSEFSYIHTFAYRYGSTLSAEAVESIIKMVLSSDLDSDSWILDTALDLYLVSPVEYEDITKRPFRLWLADGAFDMLPILGDFLSSYDGIDAGALRDSYSRMSTNSKESITLVFNHFERIGKRDTNKQIRLVDAWVVYLLDCLSSTAKFERLRGLAHILTFYCDHNSYSESIRNLVGQRLQIYFKVLDGLSLYDFKDLRYSHENQKIACKYIEDIIQNVLYRDKY